MAKNSYEKELNRYRPNTIYLESELFDKKMKIIKDKTRATKNIHQNDRRG
jgi:hypothetical protein